MKSDSKRLLDLLLDESFQRWLSNRCDDHEEKRWVAWLQQSEEHQALYEEARMLWRSASFRTHTAPDPQKLTRALLQSIQPKSLTPSFIDRLLALRFRFPRLRPVMKPALILGTAVILIISFSRLMQNKDWKSLFRSESPYQTVVTEYGQRVHLTFSDGSQIVLNARSTLKYPARWTPNTPRRFELEGEAYFHVASLPEGPQRDFIVLTRDGRIRVTGTRFSVYERGNGTRVVVEEGTVEVSPAGVSEAADSDSVAGVELRENQLVLMQRKNPGLSPIHVNAAPYTTWWQERFILDRTPFVEIARRLEETYGVTIEVHHKPLLTKTLSGAIENTNLDIVLEALARALQASVQRERDRVIFSGPGSF